MSDRLFIKDM